MQGREALVQELIEGREPVVHALWAHQLVNLGALKTTRNERVQVLFPGWLNRMAGPDFRHAQVLLDGREVRGDVEIHLDARDWQAHGHHDDPAYADVILHVVVRGGGGDVFHAASGRHIPELVLAPGLSGELMDFLQDAESMLARYEDLPGRCGLRAAISHQDALGRIIARAAETRMRLKAERLAGAPDAQGAEQQLFAVIFQALGYRPHAGVFRDLAERFPLEKLAPLLDLPYAEARRQVLSRWFGAVGLLEEPLARCGVAEVSGEYETWRQLWLRLHEPPLAQGLTRGGSRPWNSPERRMVGLFHHLYAQARDGWFKRWLQLLRQLDGLQEADDFRKVARHELDAMFDTPTWEPWRHLVSFHAPPTAKAGRLIGADRVSIVMANAIVPFFLAAARRDGDLELERLIYRLFIVLPPEAPNRKTRFMDRRLMPLHPFPKNLRSQQGLLQIHQDFCTSYDVGCGTCPLPDMISAAANQIGDAADSGAARPKALA